jgi:acetylornithine deacetylase/succinyl-diaminopimelate desuccinylase-like protein
LARVVANDKIVITPIKEAILSPPSPLKPEILEPIEQLTSEFWPGVPVVPIMSTGASDSIYLRGVGIGMYGVSGIFFDIDDVRSHGRDERIGVKEFHEGQQFLYRLVKALSTGSERGARQ